MISDDRTLRELLLAVRACRVCEARLPLGPRPVLQAGTEARILVIGQAPGSRAHASGVPWDDASGDRLRSWMGVDKSIFYDADKIAIIPMGLCYPGRGASGDLPPRPECAPLWMAPLLAKLPRIELTLLIGLHAQRHFLGARRQRSLTETVGAWRDHAPAVMPLPHPSPRNTAWFQAHPWLEQELVPALRRRVQQLLSG
ncbi:MAG: uracil-DNA glycosylase family protein [Rubrivivax sp.]|nr:uracil-DNA glycosylase family protein [Rubrivivax sp.]